MNTTAQTDVVPSLSSTDVEARIDSEHRRLLLEQNLEKQLAEQRLAPLEAGDDAALDQVEAQINACRDRQLRIQERVDLLRQRAVAARQREHDAELDRLVERAERARALGESLIHVEYPKLAQSLAALLAKLRAVDTLIAQANDRLAQAGRPSVQASNNSRCRPPRSWQEKVTKRVAFSDPAHPYYGRVVSRSQNNGEVGFLANGEMVTFMDVEVTEDRREPWVWEKPLPEAILLPGVGPAPENSCLLPLWDERLSEKAALTADTLAAEIDAAIAADSNGGVLQKIGRALRGRDKAAP